MYKRQRLCLITTPCDDLTDRVEAALRNGVGMVQYRCKAGNDRERLREAQQLRQLCNRFGALLFINDRVDLALAVDADGVHLGQDDMPSEVARDLLGSDRLLGRSTHSIDQVHQAQQEPVDYLGFGPIHSTAVKPERNPLVWSSWRRPLRSANAPSSPSVESPRPTCRPCSRQGLSLIHI